MFSIIKKIYLYDKCPNCSFIIKEVNFNYSLDQIIYIEKDLDRINLGSLLNMNFDIISYSKDCPKCNKDVKIKEITKIFKLPEILIFSLYYSDKKNKVYLYPEKYIDIKIFCDVSLRNRLTRYELFAINKIVNNGQGEKLQSCDIIREGRFYNYTDKNVKEISGKDINDGHEEITGLFYRKIK